MIVILVFQLDVHLVDFALQPRDLVSVFVVHAVLVGLSLRTGFFPFSVPLRALLRQPYHLSLHLIDQTE